MQGAVKGGRPAKPAEQRFMAKVKVAELDVCWEWTGFVNHGGYGRFTIAGRQQLTHRISYELHRGPIPDGICVCHRCDNRLCVNPNHLFLGTMKDNNDDKVSKGRQARGVDIPEAKLTEDEVVAIRAAKGISQRALGRRYGVSPTQIKDILVGKYWKHLLHIKEGRPECLDQQ